MINIVAEELEENAIRQFFAQIEINIALSEIAAESRSMTIIDKNTGEILREDGGSLIDNITGPDIPALLYLAKRGD